MQPLCSNDRLSTKEDHTFLSALGCQLCRLETTRHVEARLKGPRVSSGFLLSIPLQLRGLGSAVSSPGGVWATSQENINFGALGPQKSLQNSRVGLMVFSIQHYCIFYNPEIAALHTPGSKTESSRLRVKPGQLATLISPIQQYSLHLDDEINTSVPMAIAIQQIYQNVLALVSQ